MSEQTSGDWTCGEPELHFQECGACGARWLFRRSFCPRCGGTRVETKVSAGQGTVHAATTVTRAPSQDLRPFAPYRIVLVDADEGFRVMAHGAPDLAIADRVAVRFVRFGGGLVPYFERQGVTS